jgi:hypothetical protein
MHRAPDDERPGGAVPEAGKQKRSPAAPWPWPASAIATPRQRWHADIYRAGQPVLKTYKAGISPSSLADEMLIYCEEGGFAEYLVPGFEHGIGMLGDEWRIGRNDGPFPYWTNPDHVYQPDEMLICALQYACPEEQIGFIIFEAEPPDTDLEGIIYDILQTQLSIAIKGIQLRQELQNA